MARTVQQLCPTHKRANANMKTNKNLVVTCLSFSVVLATGCHQPLPVPVTILHETYAPGENLSALTKITESEYKCDFPAGGDNGKNLFFSVHTQGDSYVNIYKKESANNASMNEKTSGKNKNVAPSYCAATDMLAFAGRFEGASFRDIYMMNATQGSALIQVTSTPNDEENYPCLSRDGKKIVFEKVNGYGKYGDAQIWIKDLKTNETSLLGTGRMPSFSPDGRTIAYVRYASDGETMCLWLMDANGGNNIQVTNINMGSVSHPRFSPDGSQLVFQCRKPDKGDYDLYVIERNGNNPTQLTINKSYDGEPYWSTDGNIYFTSDRGSKDNHYQIWRFKYGKEETKADVHIVAQGETITQIAQKYNVTVKDLVKWNRLQTMTLLPGTRLKVSEY